MWIVQIIKCVLVKLVLNSLLFYIIALMDFNAQFYKIIFKTLKSPIIVIVINYCVSNLSTCVLKNPLNHIKKQKGPALIIESASIPV